MNCAQKIITPLVVTRGNCSVLLETSEKVLYQVPCPVKMPVIPARFLGGALWRNHCLLASRFQEGDNSFPGVITLIRNHRIRLYLRQEYIRAVQVVILSWRQVKACRVSQGVDRCVNLCTQASPAPPDRFLLMAAFFLPRRCVDAPGQLSNRSSHIRYPLLETGT